LGKGRVVSSTGEKKGGKRKREGGGKGKENGGGGGKERDTRQICLHKIYFGKEHRSRPEKGRRRGKGKGKKEGREVDHHI